MTTGATLVVVGGWGVPVAMLEPLYALWPGSVLTVSLSDEWLRNNDSPEQIAHAIVQRYPQPALWLGWSLGAQVAMAAAQSFPQSVTQVVTLGGFPQFVASQSWPWGVPETVFRRFERRFERQPEVCWHAFLAQMIEGCEHQTELIGTMNVWLQRGLPGSVAQLAKGVRWLRASCQRELWQQCGIPALHLRGSCDSVVPPWAEHLALPRHSCAVSIAGMGHWPGGHYGACCQQVIHDFLASRRAC